MVYKGRVLLGKLGRVLLGKLGRVLLGKLGRVLLGKLVHNMGVCCPKWSIGDRVIHGKGDNVWVHLRQGNNTWRGGVILMDSNTFRQL